MRYLLGIDIGTSGTKSVLFDEEGIPVGSALFEYPLYQPQNGWAEQEADDWWNASAKSIAAVISKTGVDARDIKGIGLSGQMHGLVMLDADGRPLRRSIIWCDQRTIGECEQITELCGADKLIEITANPALTGFTASKIMWVKNNEPEIFAACKKILLPKDYIRFKLTGRFAAEVSDASGMQLLDVPNRKWSEYITGKLGIDTALLADVYESYEISGEVTVEAAKITGLAVGTPVAGGAGDQAASAVGNGIVKNGVVSATMGMSGVVFAHLDSPQIDKAGRVHTFCHAVPGAWHIMGVTQAAGLSFKWFRDNMMDSEKNTAALLKMDANAFIDKIAAQSPAGANRLLYLPYLMGERTPHLDPDCRGVFFGLSSVHGKSDMLRAVLEGVVFSMNDCLAIIREMGIAPSRIYAGGGGANSALWRQMMADMFGVEIAVNNSTESGAFGAAILAGVGAGIYKDVKSACESLLHAKETMLPNPQISALYNKMYPIYKSVYKSLADDFKSLAKIHQ